MRKNHNDLQALPPRKQYRLFYTAIRRKVDLLLSAREDFNKSRINQELTILQEKFRERFGRGLV